MSLLHGKKLAAVFIIVCVTSLYAMASVVAESITSIPAPSSLQVIFRGVPGCEPGELDRITGEVEKAVAAGDKSDEVRVLVTLEPLVPEAIFAPESFNLADGRQNPEKGVNFKAPVATTPIVSGIFICLDSGSKAGSCYSGFSKGTKSPPKRILYFNYVIFYQGKAYFSPVAPDEDQFQEMRGFLRNRKFEKVDDAISIIRTLNATDVTPLESTGKGLAIVLKYKSKDPCTEANSSK